MRFQPSKIQTYSQVVIMMQGPIHCLEVQFSLLFFVCVCDMMAYVFQPSKV